MACSPEIIHELIRLLGPDLVLTAAEDLLVYAFDGTAALTQQPGCVVFARDTADIQAVLRLAQRTQTPVVTRGSGTGLSGGSLPVPGCIVLCTVRMNRILEVDPANLTLLTEPGATTLQIAEAAAAVGLFYPPDPGSMKISTIGGNVAENSGGLRGLKYGITRNYVMGLEVVLPDGEILFTGNKCVKDVAGYSLKDLFIGSEGTLGVITRILLRLIPQPAAKQTLVATFDAMDAAAQTVSDIIAAKIIPCTLEFLDRTTLRCVEDYAKIGLPDCEALLLMETDGHPAQVADEAARMEDIARANGCLAIRRAADEAEANALAGARRSAFSALARVAPTTILEDATVPRSELARMIRFVDQVAKKHRLRIGTFGHMGDGNLHPLILFDANDPDQLHRCELFGADILETSVAMGGTVTGEHGVGVEKLNSMCVQFSAAENEQMFGVKRAFDPSGLLNPGKVIPTLQRCAEYGKMLVRGGQLSHPELPRF